MITVNSNTPPIIDSTWDDSYLELGVMAHNTTTVACMKNVTQGFCQVIGVIDNARNMLHNNSTFFTPILNSEISNIDMARLLGRGHIFINNFEC